METHTRLPCTVLLVNAALPTITLEKEQKKKKHLKCFREKKGNKTMHLGLAPLPLTFLIFKKLPCSIAVFAEQQATH